jgi:hypothetical protein
MPQTNSDTDLKNAKECELETAEMDAAILEAETEYAMNGTLYDARSAFFP